MSGIEIPCLLRLIQLHVNSYNRLPVATYNLEIQKWHRYLAFTETKEQSLTDFNGDVSHVMKKNQIF